LSAYPSHVIHPTANTFYLSIILFKPMYEMLGGNIGLSDIQGNQGVYYAKQIEIPSSNQFSSIA
jgi:hypothetical protein